MFPLTRMWCSLIVLSCLTAGGFVLLDLYKKYFSRECKGKPTKGFEEILLMLLLLKGDENSLKIKLFVSVVSSCN